MILRTTLQTFCAFVQFITAGTISASDVYYSYVFALISLFSKEADEFASLL